MQNMAHVRFTNTLEALRECYEHWDDEEGKEISKAEKESRMKLFRFCERVVNTFDPEDYE